MSKDIYSIPQQRTLAITSSISGFISLLGSTAILAILWRDRRKKLRHAYHRILLGVSVYDFISSLNFIVSFLAVPKGLFWGARGSTLTCEINGFLLCLMATVALYNLGLSIYYVLVIRYGKTQKHIERFVEPFIHIISISVPFGFGMWYWLSDLFNPMLDIGGLCYVYEYPAKCSELEDIECTRGVGTKSTISLIVGTLVVSSVFTGIIVCMLLLTLHVRKREITLSRHRLNPQTSQTRQTYIQALLYIAAYFITYLFSFVQAILGSAYNEHLRFTLAFLVKLSLPLQGFFNFVIYIRPRYSMLRAQRGGSTLSAFSLLYYIVRGSKTGDQQNGFAPELDEDGSNAQLQSSYFENINTVPSISREGSNAPMQSISLSINSSIDEEIEGKDMP